ncbi:MAG: hypothetical protein IKK75_09125 [Clostridia bacterium]|nr:hypothetical protein [Clostridia bacterium]
MSTQQLCPSCGQPCGSENHFCPHCGHRMEAAPAVQSLCAMAQEKALWHSSGFEHFPSVIAHEYWRLQQLCLKDKPYGVLLQIKDLIETTLKFEIISCIAWGISNSLPDFQQVACQITTPAMSLGRWCALGGEVRRYFREHSSPGLPAALWKSLQNVLSAYEENKLVLWRNQHIGHGALGFSEDAVFQQDIRSKLTLFARLFAKLDESLRSQRLLCGEEVLMGHSCARALTFKGDVTMTLPDGQTFPLEPFIRLLGKAGEETEEEYDIYFYDNQSERVRQSEMLSYPSGRRRHQQIGFFQELYDQNRRLGTLDRNSAVDAQYRTQEQDDALNLLNLHSMEYAFVVPDFLTEWLGEHLSQADRGVFHLQMYRGTGKSTFSEMLSCLNPNPLRLAEDLDVRTYHINRSQLISADDFEAAIESLWERAYQQSAWSASSMIRIRDYRYQHGMSEAQALLAFLGQCQQYTDSMRQKQRIMLVIDGLDEIADDRLWAYLHLPADALPKGVYVLFTSRCADQSEEGLSAEVCERLLSLPASAALQVDRKQSDYLSFLAKYIRSVQLDCLSDEETAFLMRRADWRVLYLGMLCKLLESGVGLNDLNSDESLAQIYLDTLTDRYGEKEAVHLKELLYILCTFGECEALSLQEIADLTWNRGVISTDLLGKMNDLAPLLKVQRGFLAGGRQYTGVNRYAFANGDLAQAFRTLLPDAGLIALESIRFSLQSLAQYMQEARCENSAALSTSLMGAGSMFSLLDQDQQSQLLAPHGVQWLIELAMNLSSEANILMLSRLEKLLGGLHQHIDSAAWAERTQLSRALAQLYALTGRPYQAIDRLNETIDALRPSAGSDPALQPFMQELDICKARVWLDMRENLSEAEQLAQLACSRLHYACKKGRPSNPAALTDGYLVLAEIETERLRYASVFEQHLRFSQRAIHYYRLATRSLYISGELDARKTAMLYEQTGDLLWKLTASMGPVAMLISRGAVKLYQNAANLLASEGDSPYLKGWTLRLKSKTVRCLQQRLFGRKRLIDVQRGICTQYEQLDSSGWLPNRFTLAEAYLTLSAMAIAPEEQSELRKRAEQILLEKQEHTPLSMHEMNVYLDLQLQKNVSPVITDQVYRTNLDMMRKKAALDQQLFEDSLKTGVNVFNLGDQAVASLRTLQKTCKHFKEKALLAETRQNLKKVRRSRRRRTLLTELTDTIGPQSLVVFFVMLFLLVPILSLIPAGVSSPSLLFTLLIALAFLISTTASVWIVNFAWSLAECLIQKFIQKKNSSDQSVSLRTLWRDQCVSRAANRHLFSFAVLAIASFMLLISTGIFRSFGPDEPSALSAAIALGILGVVSYASKWPLILWQYLRLRYRLHQCKKRLSTEKEQANIAEMDQNTPDQTYFS